MAVELMRVRTSATVTMEDLKNYFKGEGWQLSGLTDNTLEAKSEYYDISVSAKSFKYNVSIEATEDPSDSDKGVTDDPLKFIVKFLGTGTSADEAFSKRSSTPDSLAGFLRFLALRIERNEIGPRSAARELRRTIVSTDRDFVGVAFALLSRYAARQDVEKAELDDLKKGMETKGWKVHESQTDHGLPELTVDVSGIYTARVSVQSIVWDFSFEVRGVPESNQAGQTDDPIQKFRDFYKSDSTQDAKRKVKESKGGSGGPPSSSSEETAKPGSKPSQEEKTVKPKSKPSQEERTVPARQ